MANERGTIDDTNVLLDVFTDDPKWGDWSSAALAAARDSGPVIINPIIYAELSVSFDSAEQLNAALTALEVVRAELPYDAAFAILDSSRVTPGRGARRHPPPYAGFVSSPFDDPEFRAQLTRMGVRHQPGMTKRMLEQIAPLLADEGVVLDDLDAGDLDTVNAALARATERHNLTLFTPVGVHRSLALSVLRLFTTAIADDDQVLADAILGGVPIDETDTMPAISHVIGVALGLLDTRHTDPALASARMRMRVPSWPDKAALNAARDIVPLSNKGRAFDSLDSLIVRHNGQQVMAGAALAVAASVLAEATVSGRDAADLAASVLSDEGGADAVLPASPSGSAFRRASEAATDRGEDLALAFQTWLGGQSVIAAPSVDVEMQMFRTLQRVAADGEFDLHVPDDVEAMVDLLSDAELEVDDAEGAIDNALETLYDYVGFRIDSAGHPSDWQRVHAALEDVLDVGLEEPPALREALMSAQTIPEAERRAALEQLSIVRGVGPLLDWLGSGRPITAAGGVRRQDIQEVAAMIGVSAVGVSKRTPYTQDTVYVMSMSEEPLLTAWWTALRLAGVTELTATRVRPGENASEWRGSSPSEITASFKATEFLAGMVAASIMADSYYYDPEDEAERDAVSAMVARVGEALGDGAEPVDWRYDDYMTTDRMEVMEQAGFLMRNTGGAWVVPNPLRATVARAVTTVLAAHLLPGVADGLLADDG